jgi:hypothetical protein
MHFFGLQSCNCYNPVTQRYRYGASGRENRFPIFFHAQNDPAFGDRFLSSLVQCAEG